MSINIQKDLIANIVSTIVQYSHPEKVILFGSRAKGAFTDESDYDFLVVVRGVKNEREISRQINRAILDKRIGVSVDIVVVNEEKIHFHQTNPFYIYARALSEGKIYYERPRAG